MYVEYVCGSYDDETYKNPTNVKKHEIAGGVFADIVKIISAQSFYDDESILQLSVDNDGNNYYTATESFFTHFDEANPRFNSSFIPIPTVIPPPPPPIGSATPKPIVYDMIDELSSIANEIIEANKKAMGKSYHFDTNWEQTFLDDIQTFKNLPDSEKFTVYFNSYKNVYGISAGIIPTYNNKIVLHLTSMVQLLLDANTKYLSNPSNNPYFQKGSSNYVEPFGSLMNSIQKFQNTWSKMSQLDNFDVVYNNGDEPPLEPEDFFDYTKIPTLHFVKSDDGLQGCYHVYFTIIHKIDESDNVLQKSFLYFNLSYNLKKEPSYIPYKLLFSWSDTPPQIVTGTENNPVYVLPNIPKANPFGSATASLIPKSISHIINFRPFIPSASSTKIPDFHQYKIIFSMSKNHLYISGVSDGRMLGTSSGDSSYPSYDIVNYFHQGFILSKYNPIDHWYNTPIADNYKKFENVIFWMMVKTIGTGTAIKPVGQSLNVFNTQKLETQYLSNKAPCSFKWSSSMPINHRGQNQGWQHFSKMANDKNQEVLYMLHLNMQHFGKLAITGDITSNCNIYYMHGSSGNYEEIVVDVLGRPFKLYCMHFDIKDVYANYTSTELYDTSKYPKLAIPMF
jgi:hypothetical protein